ncbi:flagellar biosynthetic protein FliO [Egicoccus sp. AB-alg2]|uniref:flagellar biosynthetic protein FliO n=1 Tax=Egicoccus sp. AB-alg2 TaxID=3242693 RepID=UPI00359D0BF4
MIDSPLLGLLLLGALAATPLLLRRLKSSQPGGVRVLGRTALHRNAVVAVVEVGDRRLLVGAGEKGIELLTELEQDPEAAAAAVPSAVEPDVLDLTTTERTDAAPHDVRSTPATEEALDALLGPVGSAANEAGPGIGLVDRLRAMTVRVSPPPRGAGRPLRVPLRR